MRHTYFIDIDGTIFEHAGTLQEMELIGKNLPPIRSSIQKISEMKHHDHKVILTTARPESMRKTTEELLNSNGVVYDLLIMGLPCGPRHVLNDKKPNGDLTAFAHNYKRDIGFGDLEIPQ